MGRRGLLPLSLPLPLSLSRLCPCLCHRHGGFLLLLLRHLRLEAQPFRHLRRDGGIEVEEVVVAATLLERFGTASQRSAEQRSGGGSGCSGRRPQRRCVATNTNTNTIAIIPAGCAGPGAGGPPTAAAARSPVGRRNRSRHRGHQLVRPRAAKPARRALHVFLNGHVAFHDDDAAPGNSRCRRCAHHPAAAAGPPRCNRVLNDSRANCGNKGQSRRLEPARAAAAPRRSGGGGGGGGGGRGDGGRSVRPNGATRSSSRSSRSYVLLDCGHTAPRVGRAAACAYTRAATRSSSSSSAAATIPPHRPRGHRTQRSPPRRKSKRHRFRTSSAGSSDRRGIDAGAEINERPPASGPHGCG